MDSDDDLDLSGVLFDILVVFAVDEYEESLWDRGLPNRFRSDLHLRQCNARRHPLLRREQYLL